jgi:hypothetical protein
VLSGVALEGAKLVKTLVTSRAVPLKLKGPNLERGLAPGRFELYWLKSFGLTLGVGPGRPPSQPRADSAFDHVIQL